VGLNLLYEFVVATRTACSDTEIKRKPKLPRA